MSDQIAFPGLDAELAEFVSKALCRLAEHLKAAGQAGLAVSLVQQAADIELLSPSLQLCWGGPFNGQQGRAAMMRELVMAVGPRTVVETGIYRGISTAWFAENAGCPVLGCDKEELYLIQARHRLRPFKDVRLEVADSRAFLRRHLPALRSSAPTLFYLDAHWGDDLPLKEELELIFASESEAVIVIDDFKVPGDPGYGWDDYGPGNCIDTTQLVGSLPANAKVYFPTLSSLGETGAKRGCCVVADASQWVVDRCSLLKGHSLAAVAENSNTAPALEDAPRQYLQVDKQAIADTQIVEMLKREITQIELDRGHRLRDVIVLTDRVQALQAQTDLLTAERVQQLQDNQSLTDQLWVSERDRAERLAIIKALQAENQGLLRDLNYCRASLKELRE